jgi:Ca2+-binding RTX toxin-like protein
MSNHALKSYQFTLQNGQVTSVYEIKNGQRKFERIDEDEAWSYDATTGQVSKTEWDDGRTETTRFSDANGDGIFLKVSKTYGVEGITLTTPTTRIDGHHGGIDGDDGRGGNFDNVFHGKAVNDHIDSNEGDDKLYGDAGNDLPNGRDGDDFLVGGQGSDYQSGGNGAMWFSQDTLYISRDADSAAEFQIEVVGVNTLTTADLVM